MLLGLYGAISISWLTITEESPCPSVMGIPVCYVILMCYVLIALALLNRDSTVQSILFYGPWAVVFVVALLATVFELSNGSTCPKSSGGFPMCYASLIYSALIGALYWAKGTSLTSSAA